MALPVCPSATRYEGTPAPGQQKPGSADIKIISSAGHWNLNNRSSANFLLCHSSDEMTSPSGGHLEDAASPLTQGM